VLTLEREEIREEKDPHPLYRIVSSGKLEELPDALERSVREGYEFVELFVEPSRTSALLVKPGRIRHYPWTDVGEHSGATDTPPRQTQTRAGQEGDRPAKEAEVLIDRRRREYNQARPHSSLGYRPPAPETSRPFPLYSGERY